MTDTSDPVLILGSGAAGLTAALHLAELGIQSVVTAKGSLSHGSTWYAQGGISAVLSARDSTEAHVRDTLDAGAGLCDEGAVRFAVEEGPQLVQWLADIGVAFTRAENGEGYHLTREGGHSARRVIHAADATGQAVESTLLDQARAQPLIRLLPQAIAVDLIVVEGRVRGAWLYDRQSRQVRTLAARATVLATGGANMAYLYTSNPAGSSGDDIAMAWRAGCRVANMEFMQFHPTILYHQRAQSFLISEAVRGEGGLLRLPDGERFMPRFDSRAELAPRDVVARAIDHEMKRLGIDHVYLDITHRDPEFIRTHFPTIHARCLEIGLNMTREPLPVVPAAHYTCGGVLTDLHGHTDLPGLYAIGETAATGLHGANRMASNSLLECLVFGRACARHIAAEGGAAGAAAALPDWDESRVTDSDEDVVVSHNWQELRRTMWNYVGIVRTNKRLERAANRIALLLQEIGEYYGNHRLTPDLIELRNLALVADLIVRSARTRRESRGLHYNRDYPQRLAQAENTILNPREARPTPTLRAS